MVNVDILEGLKAGLERKQSLKRAMMSFFNAGYNRAEIEEAARALNQEPRHELKPSVLLSPKEIVQEKKENKIKNIFSKINFQKKPEVQISSTAQKVSSYENSDSSKKSDKLIVIVLVSVLIFLVGVLVTVFFFRKEIMSWFGG